MSPVVAVPQMIESGVLYHLEEFKARMGWSKHAMRTARRQGLKVRDLGGVGMCMLTTSFVTSTAWISRLRVEYSSQS